jgi:hypothetical protein
VGWALSTDPISLALKMFRMVDCARPTKIPHVQGIALMRKEMDKNGSGDARLILGLGRLCIGWIGRPEESLARPAQPK